MAVKVTDSVHQDVIVVKNDDRFDIQKYDIDNAYPQRISYIIDGSGTLSLCVNATSKFISGEGFIDEANNSIVIDKKGTTLYKLLKTVSKDYAKYNGYALHFNYNALYQISEINLTPFQYCRLAIPNEDEEVLKVSVYNDWNRQKKRQIKKEDIVEYNVFNPDPEQIQKEVDEVEGWENYKGQILYVSEIEGSYPQSIFHSRLKDAITENEIMTYKYSSTKNGFAASHLLYYFGEFEEDHERQDFVKGININQGGENAGNIILIDGIPKDMRPELVKVEADNVDKRFEKTERSVGDNIRKQFLIPPVLIGDLVSGKLGTAQEIQDAVEFFNSVTKEYRMTVSEVFSRIMKLYKETKESDFEIKKIESYK